jgi:hypothetical protein
MSQIRQRAERAAPVVKALLKQTNCSHETVATGC